MISILNLFESKGWEKVAITKNFIVQDFKNPPKQQISKYRRKTIIDKEGKKHLLTFAILNKKGKSATGKKTVATSMWHPKSEKSAQAQVKKINSEKEM